VETTVPDREDHVGGIDRKGAGEVNGVCTAQGMTTGQLAGASFDLSSEFDQVRSPPSRGTA